MCRYIVQIFQKDEHQVIKKDHQLLFLLKIVLHLVEQNHLFQLFIFPQKEYLNNE